ncbi:MAG: tRNA (adenosine(37)-N6)-threonylcarbamoyltransferase complex ATPase subunit type 1 TsaE [Alphaproteobacteria bacterium]|nr:tRNA (adenosine(37)-N6)-threonylcarbamoyltransferase complex ATPase subunit type 1 TsaE [Alphaproteobacteria bacterium]
MIPFDVFESLSEADTIKLAEICAGDIQSHDILLLEGDLGSGKSFFTRALIRSVLEDPSLMVPSPTFTLLQTYEGPKGSVFHYDLYRLKDPEEIFNLGWEESLAEGVVIVEWPDRLGPYRPHKSLALKFENQAGTEDARKITLTDTRSRKS